MNTILLALSVLLGIYQSPIVNSLASTEEVAQSISIILKTDKAKYVAGQSIGISGTVIDANGF